MPPDPSLDLSTEITRRMRRDARAIFEAALRAVDPQKAVLAHCRREGDRLHIDEHEFDLTVIERLIVIGAGKAVAVMARAVEHLLGDRITDGLISVKYGHGVPLDRIRIMTAGHPLPDENGVTAARNILKITAEAKARDLILFLVSGGGSALLPLPAPGINLADKQAATQALLDCGADIHAVNTLRKHLSAIKGGRLAQAALPATVVTMILSDVVGDDLDVIASGPTVPDPSTFNDCIEIIRGYGIGKRLPAGILAHLAAGAAGQLPETPKKGTHDWQRSHHVIVANNFAAIQAAAREARNKGYAALILSTRIQGETREVARVHAAVAREASASGYPVAAPACILSGGETTVTMQAGGKGGRNQEFALAAAREIAGTAPIVLLSGGTDGSDGPTDAAGAIVDHTTMMRARDMGLNAKRHLDHHDAYPFFKQLGDLLITGPTLTNVMDVRVILIEKK